MKNSVLEWNSFDETPAPENEDVLVYQPWGHSGYSVKHYVAPDGVHCYGWYPGGGQTKGTFWTRLPDPIVFS